MRKLFICLPILLLAVCSSCTGSFTKSDKALIFSDPQSLMHVYVADNPQELNILRAESANLNRSALKSEAYRLLAQRMSTTVQDSTVGGVGIAGPQVGINKRIVVVQRFDQPEAPFVAYPNIRILSCSEAQQLGFEGCLSIPGRREQVSRAEKIVISYTDPISLEEVQETVEGFTAVIFQHEIDHLEGILYTDRVEEEEMEE